MMRSAVRKLNPLMLVIVFAVALSGCAQNASDQEGARFQGEIPQPPTSPQDPVSAPDPLDPGAGPVLDPEPHESSESEQTLGPSPQLGVPSWFFQMVPWRARKGSALWTEAVIKVVRRRLADFERARDKDDFCPGYQLATNEEREMCWLLLIAGVTKKESNFDPMDKFHEGGGRYSYGLMSLSPGECPNAPAARDLYDPVRNLACGTNIMAKLIARHGFIDGPKSSRGAAAYWSTLRKPYTSAGYSLGKKKEIMAITRGYRKPAPK
jgi:hypothetical protein